VRYVADNERVHRNKVISLARTPVLLLLTLIVACSRPADISVLAITHVTIVDVERGRLLPDRTVLVYGTRIQRVDSAPRVDLPPRAQTVDGTGRFLIPGLWDMHVHLMINGHSDYTHWDKTYPAQFEPVIMPASAKPIAAETRTPS